MFLASALSQRHFAEAYGVSSNGRHLLERRAARRALPEKPHADLPPKSFVLPRPDPVARLLERLHDARLVRSSQIQGVAHGGRHHRELGIAFIEYCFAVPANRIGNAAYSPAELKSLQEVITLGVFAGFTAIYFKEPLTLIQGAGFALIALGALLVFKG